MLGAIRGHQGCRGVRGVFGVASGLGAWPHWAPVQVPALPLVPLGEWPTWPRPSKWQASIYIWNYISWQFSHLYLHHLITYSYMQYKEMLYGRFSLQTNLHISLHYQSDVLWHSSTNYKELLFSSDILAGTFFYKWNWFGVVVFQRCMVDYWGANDIATTTRTTTHGLMYINCEIFCSH